MWIIKFFEIQCFYPPRILNEHWCFYSCLQIPPRENWFQYVRRVYTINLPCISILLLPFRIEHQCREQTKRYCDRQFSWIDIQVAIQIWDCEPFWTMLFHSLQYIAVQSVQIKAINTFSALQYSTVHNNKVQYSKLNYNTVYYSEH